MHDYAWYGNAEDHGEPKDGHWTWLHNDLLYVLVICISETVFSNFIILLLLIIIKTWKIPIERSTCCTGPAVTVLSSIVLFHFMFSSWEIVDGSSDVLMTYRRVLLSPFPSRRLTAYSRSIKRQYNFLVSYLNI